MFLIQDLVLGLAVLFAQPAQSPSLAFDPTFARATGVHWTITLSAPFCGGFRIGDGVYLQPEPPLALPAQVPADAVRFAGQPADVQLQGGVLRVAPSRTLVQPMFCQTGARPFTVELLGSLGLTNPDPGDYTVDVWLDSGGTPQPLPITIDAPMAGTAPATACDPIRQSVDTATATLHADNAALATTFDAIRAQSAAAPALAAITGDLVQQLDDVQATGKAMAANGWNPNVADAVPAIDWAQGPAQADLTVLHTAAPQPGVAMLISLIQLAQQQAEDANTATLRLQSAVTQFGDCGLGLPAAP